MTIEEAIKREEALAYSCGERYKRLGEPVGELDKLEQEHKQMAEWLEELKGLRIAVYKLSRIPYGEHLTYKADDVWKLFGTYFADFEQEVMDYEEVNADEDNNT